MTGKQIPDEVDEADSDPSQDRESRSTESLQDQLNRRLASMVAHDLGSPLYLLQADLRFLSDGYLENQPEKRRWKYIEMLSTARQMDGVIDCILSLSGRELPVSLREVSVANVVHEAVRASRRYARAKKVQVNYPAPDKESEQSSLLLTDERKLYVTILNLLSNALKYTPPRTSVEVGLRRHSTGIDIRVSDEGPGIPKQERELIFQPFYRGSSSVESSSGQGLGLYLAKLYIELLGGRLQMMDRAGQGATALIFLPSGSSSKL